jgi:hypothetical protein
MSDIHDAPDPAPTAADLFWSPLFLPIAAQDLGVAPLALRLAITPVAGGEFAWPVADWAQKGLGGGDCLQLRKTGAYAGRMWGPSGGVCPDGRIVVPSLNGPVHWNTASLDSARQRAGEVGLLLGPNEVDTKAAGFEGWTDTPLAVLGDGNAWIDYYEAIRTETGCLLASPSTAHGVWWLMQWRARFVVAHGRPPAVDVIDVHCYMSSYPQDTAQKCRDRLDAALALASDWGVEWVILSEWGSVPFDEWSIRRAWQEADPFLWAVAREPRVLFAFLFMNYADPDRPWHGADWETGIAGHEWNSAFTDEGLITYHGRAYAALGPDTLVPPTSTPTSTPTVPPVTFVPITRTPRP